MAVWTPPARPYVPVSRTDGRHDQDKEQAARGSEGLLFLFGLRADPVLALSPPRGVARRRSSVGGPARRVARSRPRDVVARQEEGT
jgi:hypothetical protein